MATLTEGDGVVKAEDYISSGVDWTPGLVFTLTPGSEPMPTDTILIVGGGRRLF